MTARKNNPKSARLAAMHESAAALHCVGAVGDMTMRHFDTLCLDPVVDLNSGLYIRRNRNLASEERSRLTREAMVDVDAGTLLVISRYKHGLIALKSIIPYQCHLIKRY